jgi:hypothetical protein
MRDRLKAIVLVAAPIAVVILTTAPRISGGR